MKRKLRILLCLILAVSMFVPSVTHAKKVKIKLSKTSFTLKVGQSKTLKVNGTKKKVKWSSSKKSVATVSKKGKVTAKKQGKTTIMAKVSDKKLKCKVTVKSKKVTNNNTSNTSKPESTPNTSQPAGNSGDSKNDTSNKIPQMEDVPQFYGFKNYEGVELNGSSEIHLNSYSSYIEFEEKEPTIYDINQNDYLYVKLEYINKKRDKLTEIILDDSDYGINQIYTTDASINKIVSVDTYYDEGKSAYVSDVLLKMPKTKSSSKRKITIRESSFLRELLGLTGVVDLSKAKTTEIEYNVSANPIPSYNMYFNFEENGEGTFKVVSIATSDLPDILYIPPTYHGGQVTEIGDASFEGARMKKLIIPSSVKKIGNNMTGMNGAPNLSSIIMMGYTPSLGDLSLTKEQNEGGCKIYVPLNFVSQYRNASSSWLNYKEIMYYADRDGVITPLVYGNPTSTEPAEIITVDLSSNDVIGRTVHIGDDFEKVNIDAVKNEKGICFSSYGKSMYVDFSKYLTSNNIKLEDVDQIEVVYQVYNLDGTKVEEGEGNYAYGMVALADEDSLDGNSSGIRRKYMDKNNISGGTIVFGMNCDTYTIAGVNLYSNMTSANQYYVVQSIKIYKYCGASTSKWDAFLIEDLIRQRKLDEYGAMTTFFDDSPHDQSADQYTWDENKNLIRLNWEVVNLSCSSSVSCCLSFGKFKSLQELICSGLNELDLTKNTALTSLRLSGCGVTNLDLSKNTGLTSLSLSGCGVTNLDLSNNTALTTLNIEYCSDLKTLDVTNCTQLTDINVHGCSPTIIGR